MLPHDSQSDGEYAATIMGDFMLPYVAIRHILALK
jgi:hypothetical protein